MIIRYFAQGDRFCDCTSDDASTAVADAQAFLDLHPEVDQADVIEDSMKIKARLVRAQKLRTRLLAQGGQVYVDFSDGSDEIIKALDDNGIPVAQKTRVTLFANDPSKPTTTPTSFLVMSPKLGVEVALRYMENNPGTFDRVDLVKIESDRDAGLCCQLVREDGEIKHASLDHDEIAAVLAKENIRVSNSHIASLEAALAKARGKQ